MPELRATLTPRILFLRIDPSHGGSRRTTMTDNAPNLESIKSELQEKPGTDVRRVSGNVLTFTVAESTYGKVDMPAYPNWYVDSIRKFPSGTVEVTLTHVV